MVQDTEKKNGFRFKQNFLALTNFNKSRLYLTWEKNMLEKGVTSSVPYYTPDEKRVITFFFRSGARSSHTVKPRLEAHPRHTLIE